MISTGRGGEWVRGDKEAYFKAVAADLNWALQKEHAAGDKQSCCGDDAERKDAGIPPLAVKAEGGLLRSL